MLRRLLLVALVCAAATATILAKEYRAERYDVRIEVLSGGDIKVTETIVFAFTDGTFSRVFRTIPTRYTDGVEFVRAAMDGETMTRGEGPGQVEVRRKDGLRVEWHFGPVSPSTHTFELEYLVRGVVKQAEGSDLLEWRVLPREHDYAIGSSTVELVAPVAPSAMPRIETRRVDGGADVSTNDTSVIVRAADIRRNGSFIVSVRFPASSVLDGPPAWQARRAAQWERMPIWVTAAGGVLLAGLVLLFALRQNYDAPPPPAGAQWNSMIPPDPLPPALAGALVSNGSPRLEHAMATLVSLAERGIIRIREESKGAFGQRNFTIERVRDNTALAPHEEIALDLVTLSGGPGSSVPLSKARSLLMKGRNWKTFERAVLGELDEAQLLDARRMASRGRFLKTGFGLLALAVAALAPCILLIEDNGGWPLLVPLAIGLVAIIAFIIMSAQTPLSNEGVRRAEQWRAFRDHIKDPQRIEPRWGSSGTADARILPMAVALGLAAAWSKFMKKRNTETPDWFQPASSLENGQAFAVFVATSGATHGGGAHAGGVSAGVAGGGASGAS